MIGKRGYSLGPQFFYHFDVDKDGWYVFDARTDEVVASGLKRWEAYDECLRCNGNPIPYIDDYCEDD